MDYVIGALLLAMMAVVVACAWMTWRLYQRATRPPEPAAPGPVEPPAPLAVDPEDPPSWRVYHPAPGRPRLACHCHDRALEPDQDVLWWPLGDGRVVVFCAEGAREA